MTTLESRKLTEETTAVLEAYIAKGGKVLRLKAWKLMREMGVSEGLLGNCGEFSRELAKEWLKDLES